MSTDRDDSLEPSGTPQTRIGTLLQEASDVRSPRDFASAAWEAAEERQRRVRWGLASGLAAVAAAAALVLAFAIGPFAGDAPSDPVPAGPTDGPAVGGTAATMVFYQDGTGAPDVEQDFRPAEVDDVVDRSWVLGGALAGGLAPVETVVGASAETSLEFAGADGTGLTLRIEDCGGLAGQTALVGGGGEFTIGEVFTNDIGCPAHVQQSEDFWMSGLAQGRVSLQVSADARTLLVGLPARPDTDTPSPVEPPTAERAAGVVPLGGGVTIPVPEGWVAVYRGSPAEGLFVTCLVPDGASTDPTMPCEGLEVTTGLTEETRPAATDFFEPADGQVPCYADPDWPGQSPSENAVTVREGAREGGWQAGEGGFVGEWRYWIATCADGQEFWPTSYWIDTQTEGGRTLVTSLTLADSTEELDRLTDRMSELATETEIFDVQTLDAQVVSGADTHSELLLRVYGPDDPPVGTEGAQPSQLATYHLTDSTQCLLHDTSQEPGVGLEVTDCVQLMKWLYDETAAGREALVTIITDHRQQLVQIRPLYTP
ncbi:hypothetical protein [Ornithinicoccus hortensis]|uniref:Uncharacterized protein n=1 Tax=Ornithinicoccus hortensis TaxID=82346 RepID=A0A542YSI6_9MICO|nr:hypothetical protein [Ornithinicoccus hortensis]TQL50904.1 hypothetical protein FB467_2024 [Ornithinicoccus hortensis]